MFSLCHIGYRLDCFYNYNVILKFSADRSPSNILLSDLSVQSAVILFSRKIPHLFQLTAASFRHMDQCF